MAYGQYLKLDQQQWYRDDFSDTNKLTGTIYTDKSNTVAFNLTGYTLKIRMMRNNRWGDHFGKQATIVTAADGTWSYAVTTGDMPPPGIYNVKLELTRANRQESTLNRQELYVLEGAVG